MPVIYIEEVSSTNDYLKSMILNNSLEDFTWLVAASQTQGKGQRGNHWQSRPGENLTFSVYKQYTELAIEDQFKIAMQTALAVSRVLSQYVQGVSVKWPNDILVGNKKIGGMLIETSVKGSHINWAIIGIGLNIQQTSFNKLPHATSLALEGVSQLVPAEILKVLITEMTQALKDLEALNFIEVKAAYEAALYGRGLVRQFVTPDGKAFSGVIQGVTRQGALALTLLDGSAETYMLKKISMRY